MKVFSAKFCNPQCARCVYAGTLRMREGHTYIIIGPEQSTKVFSAKFSFCTETRKFSPSKVFCYTVHTQKGRQRTDIQKERQTEDRYTERKADRGQIYRKKGRQRIDIQKERQTEDRYTERKADRGQIYREKGRQRTDIHTER